jgi:hypothetical protein
MNRLAPVMRLLFAVANPLDLFFESSALGANTGKVFDVGGARTNDLTLQIQGSTCLFPVENTISIVLRTGLRMRF